MQTNAFVDLNGVPYLLGEYIGVDQLQQIDRSCIYSNINVDQTEAMRAVVDICVDDIGKRASDGLPAVQGNTTKMRNLLNMIQRYAGQMDHHLNVLRSSIVLRVNYRLENNRTGQVIRSMVEQMRIDHRGYFLDVNPRDVNDNAIVSNYSSSMVSTINQFTHGIDPMILRITSVQMFYEWCQPTPHDHHPHSMVQAPVCRVNYGSSPDDLYNYHKNSQAVHQLGEPMGAGMSDPTMYIPQHWSDFNKFYHFERNGMDLILHHQEIYDPATKNVFIPCGTINVNRAFYINPGHRIIFKFSIWKNDVTIINNPVSIARALNAPIMSPEMHHHDHPLHPCDPVHPDYSELLRMWEQSNSMDYTQNATINQLKNAVVELAAAVKELRGEDEGTEPPVIPSLPETPPKPVHPTDPIQVLMEAVTSLQNQINELKDAKKDEPPVESETSEEPETPEEPTPVEEEVTTPSEEEETPEETGSEEPIETEETLTSEN